MRKRTKVFIALVIANVGVAVAVTLTCLHNKEPSYAGRTLTEWSVEYEEVRAAAWEANKPETAALHSAPADAIRHIGTNAIPIALRWISWDPPHYFVRTKNALEPIADRMDLTPLWRAGEDRMERAAEIFQILGTNAAPAIPALTYLAVNTNVSYAGVNAVIALGGMGRPGAQALISIIRNRTNPNRIRATSALIHCDPKDRDIIEPALEECLKDPDPTRRISHWAKIGLRNLNKTNEECAVVQPGN